MIKLAQLDATIIHSVANEAIIAHQKNKKRRKREKKLIKKFIQNKSIK